MSSERLNPNVAYLYSGKTRESTFRLRRTAHRLGQVEAYLRVGEVLSEASTAVDGVLSRERKGVRFRVSGVREEEHNS